MAQLAEQLIRAFNLQNVNIIQPNPVKYNLPLNNPTDTQLYRSSIGTPVLVDLTFLASSYTDENGNNYTFNDFTLETVLITINQQKNIVKTQIQGRKGTVKEYIGLGDWVITINAIIPGTNGAFPKFEMEQLKIIAGCPKAIAITSWYLQMFDINSIVVENFDTAQEGGMYSTPAFTMGCVSDEDVNLRFG